MDVQPDYPGYTKPGSFHMNVTGYVERVNWHLDRLGVTTRPDFDAYLEAWNNQIPARKMAESYKRRLNKERNRMGGDKVTGPRPPVPPAPTSTADQAASEGG